MNEYLLLFKGPNYGDLGLSPEEIQQKLGYWWEWQQKLEAKGIYKGGHALKSNIRNIEGGEMLVTDQSSAGLKEVIGGYFLIEAKSLEEATEIAKDYPDFEPDGSVEVREIERFES